MNSQEIIELKKTFDELERHYEREGIRKAIITLRHQFLAETSKPRNRCVSDDYVKGFDAGIEYANNVFEKIINPINDNRS